jgi:hypothetical protein
VHGLSGQQDVKVGHKPPIEADSALGEFAKWPQHYMLRRAVSIAPQSHVTVSQKLEHFKELAETFDPPRNS